MKVALNTVDIFPGRERLMPFRIVVEMAKVMRANGIEADIINTAVSQDSPQAYKYEGINIVQAPRDFAALSNFINEQGYDVFFFPATFRDGLKNLVGLKSMQCKKIAYIGSGINPKYNALTLLKDKGWKEARPFVLEAFTPKAMLDKKLHGAGFTDAIGLTQRTASQFNFLNRHTFFAGKDMFEHVSIDNRFLEIYKLKYKKFILFSGAPAPTRGAEMLLSSIGTAVKEAKDLYVVFLMRTDVGSKYKDFLHATESSPYKDHFIVIRETLNTPQLKAFMQAAWAMVLPFICIPSEIPITYYEALSVGTPVISFENGGTTEYLSDCILNAGTPSANHLAKALVQIWKDGALREMLSQRGTHLMKNHPTWDEVGKQWITLL